MLAQSRVRWQAILPWLILICALTVWGAAPTPAFAADPAAPAITAGLASAAPQDLAPTLLGGIAAVTAGMYHTCALLQDGTIQCWGANNQGQLGITPNWIPTPVVGATIRELFLPAIAATR